MIECFKDRRCLTNSLFPTPCGPAIDILIFFLDFVFLLVCLYSFYCFFKLLRFWGRRCQFALWAVRVCHVLCFGGGCWRSSLRVPGCLLGALPGRVL